MLSVERGWHNFREVDRVVYDPAKVTVAQMEQWLKEANTYVETVPESSASEPPKENKDEGKGDGARTNAAQCPRR